MLHVVLYQPEIPPNTGNIIRLCANTGTDLHLIAPLGFELEDRQLRRAGLDYHEWTRVQVHDSLDEFFRAAEPARLFALSTKGRHRYDQVPYEPGDAFLLGPETRGLPVDLLQAIGPDHVLRLPMRPESRSLNLSNAAAVIVYEAWRQLGFAGGG